MGQSLRVDTDLLRSLTPELAAIADAAQQELTRLKDRLATEGECWGNDEPGRVFGDTYEPAAEDGITGFENLVHNLRGMSTGVAGVDDTFQNKDHELGSQIRDQPDSFEPSTFAPISPSPGQPGWNPQPQPVTTPNDTEASPAPGVTAPVRTDTPEVPVQPNVPGYQPTGNPASPFQPNAGNYGPSATPDLPDQDPGPSTAAAPPARDPAAPSAPAPSSPASQMPTPPAATPPSATTTPKAGPPDPAASRSRPPDSRWTRPPSDTPWLRSAPGTPWSRNLPGSPSPGQVFPPRRTGPEPNAAKSAKSGKGAEPRQPKRVSAKPERSRVRTDPAAVAAAQALAARHGLRIIGFETSGAEKRTVDELAAAVDAILGKYPFLDLAGIEITDLRDGNVSRVAWDRAVDEGQERVPGGWILLDRFLMANPALLSEKLAAAARAGDRVAGSEGRSMYASIVRDLGRIMEAAAGSLVRQLAQRSLIMEYRRISGPWDRGDTLAAVVRGYREWRGELSSACFSGGRFDPRAAVVEAFTEVELHGDSACGPAKVLHRLAIEHVRGQSSA